MGEIPITVMGDIEPRAVEQLRRCAAAGDAVAGAICADGHVGYSQPIGGVLAYPDHVSPTAVGFDIACGNKAVRTDILVDDVRPDLPRIMDDVFQRISFGVGRNNSEPVDHPVLDAIFKADFRPQRNMVQMARNQLGTVGAGNHYVAARLPARRRRRAAAAGGPRVRALHAAQIAARRAAADGPHADADADEIAVEVRDQQG